jgi:hypothetical protein
MRPPDAIQVLRHALCRPIFFAAVQLLRGRWSLGKHGQNGLIEPERLR